MSVAATTPSSSRPLDINTIRSRIAELVSFEEDSGHGTEEEEEEEELLNDVAYELENKINSILLEHSSNLNSLPSEENIDEILRKLKKELVQVQTENADMECEIEKLQVRCAEDYGKMESDVEKLRCSLEIMESQNTEKETGEMQIDVTCPADDQNALPNDRDSNFKILELSHQIEKNKKFLKSLKDLDSIFNRFEVVEKVEDALSGLRVIDVGGNYIRLSLKTYVPYLETVLRQQSIENVIDLLETNHELTIETVDGTWEVKNVEIFPNDVYIGETLDATKALSLKGEYPRSSNPSTRENREDGDGDDNGQESSLELFVRRVLDRIVLSSLRRFVVKNINTSRHSFEYLDREETIVAHLVGGIDAFIKLPQGWPLSDLGLELISLKSTSQYSKEVSLSFLCQIMEVANSLNKNSRQNIKSFADSVEDILMQQTRAQLQPAGYILQN